MWNIQGQSMRLQLGVIKIMDVLICRHVSLQFSLYTTWVFEYSTQREE